MGALIYLLSVNYISGVNFFYLIKLLIPFQQRFLCRLGLSVGFLYRLGFRIRVSSGHFCIFSVLGLSLGAGLIIDFVSVRDGLIIAHFLR